MANDIFSKKYQVFISSTYKDLIGAREAVIKMLLNIYQIPIGMEMFSADNEEQWETIKGTIDSSDYYVLILGHRYGSETKEGVGYTEKEFDYARSIGLPVYAFIRNDNVATLPEERETDGEKGKKQAAFRAKASADAMVDFWGSELDLVNKVTIALTKAFVKTPRIGWIRGDQGASIKVSEEVAVLSKENRELKRQLQDISNTVQYRKPAFKLLINNQDALTVKIPSVTDDPLGLILPLDKATLENYVVERIGENAIDEYNDSLLTNEEQVELYNQNRQDWHRAFSVSVIAKFSIVNIGTCLAKNVIAEILLPDTLFAYEYFPGFPRYPRLKGTLINPISRFDSEYDSFRNDPFESSTYPNKNNRISTDKNLVKESEHKLLISSKLLLHTRSFDSINNVFITPIQQGKMKIIASIICEELSEPYISEYEIEFQ